MGATARKQFVKIAGRPIIAYTLDVFERTSLVDHMVIVVPRDAIDWVRDEIVAEYGYKKVHAIVYGGETRQESVANGLKALKSGTRKVLIHDAVRPLVSETLIRRVLDASEKTGAAITAVPAKDTVKRVESGDIVGTLDRRLLWLAQTPQCFNYEVIVAAHNKAQGRNLDAADDAALVEASGVKVAVAVGSYSNLKMTAPEDLPMFEYFLEQDVKVKIDSAVDQGGRARPSRHRRRRPRRGRRGEGGEANQAGEQGGPSGRQHSGSHRGGRGGHGEGQGGGEQGGQHPGGQRRQRRPDRSREHGRRRGGHSGGPSGGHPGSHGGGHPGGRAEGQGERPDGGRPREHGRDRLRGRPREHPGHPREQRRDHRRGGPGERSEDRAGDRIADRVRDNSDDGVTGGMMDEAREHLREPDVDRLLD
jgi:2-C-methyl-D-erythritol 4-phosphate cytidylyltransferase